MHRTAPLPEDLGPVFSVAAARASGVTPGRLRSRRLERPFRGVRAMPVTLPEEPDGFARRRAEALRSIRAYAQRMTPREFFSHESAALLWSGPLPPGWNPDIVHVGVIEDGGLPRADGVRGHRLRPEATELALVDGFRVTSAAATWASIGRWALDDQVALGDHLCRVWRTGHGRPDAGRPALATTEGLRAALRSGRRIGGPRLREAVELIRCDSWSPQETRSRLALVRRGLPEPALNADVFDRNGRFLACTDMSYPAARVAIEYQGRMHHESYAEDIERIERLRAAGWTVIQITAALLADPQELARRVRAALRSRGAL